MVVVSVFTLATNYALSRTYYIFPIFYVPEIPEKISSALLKNNPNYCQELVVTHLFRCQ